MTEKMLKECTVRIETVESEEESEIGTGFFIERNRIATCYHVIANSKDIKIFWKRNRYEAEVLDKDEKSDVAVLEAYINNEKFVEIDGEVESKNGYICYGFPKPNNDEDEIFGEPLSFNSESKKIKTGDGLYKFKDGNFQSGYSGSAILNLDTGKVCAIVKYSRDIHTDLGGKGIPISKLNLLDYREKQLDKNSNKLSSDYLPREEDMSKIKKLLLENNNQYIGLSGMGGIGKSVFAIELSEDEDVKQYFKDGIYFLYLGEKLNIEDIQHQLFYYFNIENSNPETIKYDIEKFFTNKKALLIIDDVWNINDINRFVRIKSRKSKILITTRDRRIVRGMRAKEYQIDLLNREQSIKLLEKRVGKIKDNLLFLAEQILEKCGDLPLAINIIGDILKGKDKENWESVLKKLEKAQLEKLKNINPDTPQHENLFKVIDLSVNYLDSEYRDKYLSLNIFQSIKSIPKETLKTYWDWGEEEYLDIIDGFIDASLLFKDNIRGKIFYHVHDLQAYYIKKVDNGEYNYKKRIRKQYKKKYDGNWSDIDIEDSYFYNNYQNIFKEKDVKKISKNILYKQKQLGVSEIKKIIDLLELDEKIVAEKLSKTNENPFVSIWIKNTGSIHEVSTVLAPKYLKQDIQNLDNDLILKYMDILGKSSKVVQEFAKKYLEEKNIEKLDSNIAKKCLDILNKNSIKSNKFLEKYIKFIIDNINKVDNSLVSKILKILDEDSEIVRNFAEEYIKQDMDLLDDYVSYRCLNILDKNSKEIKIFARKYIEKDIETLENGIAIKCLDILDKEEKKAEEFAEKYINKDNPHPYLFNSCLSFLSPDNEKRKKFAENILESKTNRGKPKLHIFTNAIQAQILYTEIDNRRLREKNALKILNFLKRNFTKRDMKFFIDNRVLYNACLLVFKDKPYRIKDFSQFILDNWEEEIKFRIIKPKYKYYHWHIITALENPKIEKESIKIARKILEKDNELNEIAIKNIDKEHFFVSYRLDDTIHELIKKDILKNRFNRKETNKILDLLKASINIRKKFRKMNSEIEYGKGSGNGRYIQAINVLSYFFKVHNNLQMAIKYKQGVVSMIEKELEEKYNENWEKKLKINKEELSKMENKVVKK